MVKYIRSAMNDQKNTKYKNAVTPLALGMGSVKQIKGSDTLWVAG